MSYNLNKLIKLSKIQEIKSKKIVRVIASMTYAFDFLVLGSLKMKEQRSLVCQSISFSSANLKHDKFKNELSRNIVILGS
jgi:hypothetical protein